MHNQRLLSRLLSTVLLLVLVVGLTWLLVSYQLIELFPAALLALVSFFGVSLMITQFGLSREMDRLSQKADGLGEFEGDINRRLLALEGEKLHADAEITGGISAQLEKLSRSQTQAQERLRALEKQADLGFETVSADEGNAAAQSSSAKSASKAAKPASLSRIKLKSAINSDNLSLHLQPIVGLPMRQPEHYEALMRLQMKDNEFLDAGQFLKIAEKGGLMPSIDKKVVFSAVRMLRTLEVLKKRAGLFCNISSDTLSDARAFREISNILQANIALNKSLVFEIPQRQYRHLKPKEKERLAGLADMGFALSLDQVLDMKLDVEGLRKLGFRYIKVSAGILLHANLDDNAPAPPSELASKLAEGELTLIATEVERETEIMNLIDFGVQSAQGLAFAPPRPIKSELLQPNTSIAPKATRSKAKASAKASAVG